MIDFAKFCNEIKTLNFARIYFGECHKEKDFYALRKVLQGMLTKNNKTNSSRRSSSSSNSSSSSSSIDNNNNNNNKATMKSRTSFSVNTTTSETIAFEDEFNGLAGSISSSISQLHCTILW